MPVIDVRNIKKTYQMGRELVYAIRDISATINENEYVALMGPSGSGKSTLMNIIGCLDTPTSGEYYLEGENVSALSGDKLAHIRNKKIGFVFQTFNLLPRMTALENVALPLIYSGLNKSKRLVMAEYALSIVGLQDRMTHRPNELSGGQRQRVAIARALVNKPAIILADEPTGNLESKTSIEIMEIFREINEAGNTIILVTHEHSIAEYAGRKIQLLDGLIEYDSAVSATL